jgi:hypothetical protein
MATKKKAVINYRKIAEEFAIEVDDVLFALYETKDMTLNGELTHKDLINDLFNLCSKLENAMSKYEASTDED